jgi:hypothetical protein
MGMKKIAQKLAVGRLSMALALLAGVIAVCGASGCAVDNANMRAIRQAKSNSAIAPASAQANPAAQSLSASEQSIAASHHSIALLASLAAVLLLVSIGLLFTPLSTISKIIFPLAGAFVMGRLTGILSLPFFPWISLGTAVIAIGLTTYEIVRFKSLATAISADAKAPPRRLPSRHTLRTKLWRTGGLLAIFIGTMMIGNAIIPADKAVTWDMLGHDFLCFYFAGTSARTGHYEQLYDLPLTRDFEFKTGHDAKLQLGTSFGPYWNPPFAAWMFAPLSALPYLKALHVWWLFSTFCLAISMFLMCRMLGGGWKTQLLVPLLILTSMPCFQAFCHGQNTFFSLFLLTTTIWLWRNGQSLLAGIVCGLLFYKPQLGLVAAAVLCICQGRRAMLGLAITGAALLWINVLTMPGSLKIFFHQMPLNMIWMQQEHHYRWERHITFKGFWRLAIQGWAMGPDAWSVDLLWALCEIPLLAGLAVLAWKFVRGPRTASARDRLIAAAIIAMPPLMPFYFDYDLVLISVGIVLYAADRQRDFAANLPANWEDRTLVRLFVFLFVCLEFTMLLGQARVHPIVPILTAASALLIRRGLRPQASSAIDSDSQTTFTPAALAA